MKHKSQKTPETDAPQTSSLAVVEQQSVEGLISQAITAKVPVETMEKLLAMRRELKAEFAREQFYRDMAAFQAECPVIKKDRVVMNKGGRGIRYRYAPIDSIVSQTKELILKHGFSYKIDTITTKETEVCAI